MPTVTLLSVGILCAVAVLMRQPWRQVWVFPSGRVLGLEGVTFTHGHQHQRAVGQWWQKALGPLLPPELRPREITVGAPSGPNRSSLIFWFSIQKEARPLPRSAQAAQLRLASEPYPCAEATDETGDTVGPQSGARLNALRQEGAYIIPVEVFPRRGREVRLRFNRRDRNLPAVEFRIPNPVPDPYPVWRPEAFPIHRRTDDFSCTLTSLVTGLGDIESNERAVPGVPPLTRATFRMRRGTLATREWEPVGVTLSDATGNVLSFEDEALIRRGNEQSLYFRGALSLREAAWKLRVELSRTATASFSPEESWTVRGVAVPAARQSTPSGEVVTRKGVRVRFLELAGTDRAWYKPRVRLTVEGRMDDLRLTVRARDQKGRVYAGYGTSTHGRQQLRKTRCDYFLNLPPDARVLDLTFAVHRSRYVEFLARPTPP